MVEVPSYLSASVGIPTFLFAVSFWFLFHRAVYASKLKEDKLKFSLAVAFVLFAWFASVMLLSFYDFFAWNALIAPNLVLGWLVLFVTLKQVYYNDRIRAVFDLISVPWLIAIQFFRIVGYSFFQLYEQGFLPATFALASGWGDIIVGVTAPIVALFYFMKFSFAKKLAIAWSVVGIVDLIVALSTGILSYPRPVQVLATAPSTEIIALFPMVIVPLFAVPLAFLLHLLTLRLIVKK